MIQPLARIWRFLSSTLLISTCWSWIYNPGGVHASPNNRLLKSSWRGSMCKTRKRRCALLSHICLTPRVASRNLCVSEPQFTPATEWASFCVHTDTKWIFTNATIFYNWNSKPKLLFCPRINLSQQRIPTTPLKIKFAKDPLVSWMPPPSVGGVRTKLGSHRLAHLGLAFIHSVHVCWKCPQMHFNLHLPL